MAHRAGHGHKLLEHRDDPLPAVGAASVGEKQLAIGRQERGGRADVTPVQRLEQLIDRRLVHPHVIVLAEGRLDAATTLA